MLWTCLLSMLIMVVVSYAENKGADHEKGIPLSKQLFATGPAFNISATIICLLLVLLYALFW
jgi:SSS family solute:Na+ symporter